MIQPGGEPQTRPAPPPGGGGEDPALERAALAVAAGRDREAGFRLLFERFHRPVERFFARRGVPPEDALDLTQETFLCIYRGLERYRSEDRLSHWVLRIAATTYLQWVRAGRAAKRSGREVPQEVVAAVPPPALRVGARQLDALIAGEERRALRQAVRELPDQMRNCLLLRLDQGLKYGEIATLMRLSVDTVKAHLAQARRRVKERLGEPAARALEGGPG